MQHRAVHRFGEPHHEAPLLPVQQQAQATLRVTRRQLQRAGVNFLFLMILFVVVNYHRHYQMTTMSTFSSCPGRLAALGLKLNAVPSNLPQFATSSNSVGTGEQLTLKRHQLYKQMSAALMQHGLTLGGVITQGITQDELFKRTEAAGKWAKPKLQPVMRQLQVPVRAVVLPLMDHDAAMQLHNAVRHALQQVLSDDSVWYQDESLMHSTLYHASTYGMHTLITAIFFAIGCLIISYQHPVAATNDQVHQEVAAVATVAAQSCPIRAVLDRVVISSTGVVVACWQVLPGSSEPAAVRAALRTALPAAPPAEKQAIMEPSILHITVARLLAPAKLPGVGHMAQSAGQVWDTHNLQQALEEVAADLSDELCGLTTYFEEMWYVEEHSLLALALGGKYAKHASQLRCSRHLSV